ncbi:hypothetical protein N599_25765 [Saccharopolyspora erythraea D]|nr:hypothetical protein N599_25765 [Saccharopolyspora erythraea D]
MPTGLLKLWFSVEPSEGSGMPIRCVRIREDGLLVCDGGQRTLGGG